MVYKRTAPLLIAIIFLQSLVILSKYPYKYTLFYNKHTHLNTFTLLPLSAKRVNNFTMSSNNFGSAEGARYPGCFDENTGRDPSRFARGPDGPRKLEVGEFRELKRIIDNTRTEDLRTLMKESPKNDEQAACYQVIGMSAKATRLAWERGLGGIGESSGRGS